MPLEGDESIDLYEIIRLRSPGDRSLIRLPIQARSIEPIFDSGAILSFPLSAGG
jgi:hypothetical protein